MNGKTSSLWPFERSMNCLLRRTRHPLAYLGLLALAILPGAMLSGLAAAAVNAGATGAYALQQALNTDTAPVTTGAQAITSRMHAAPVVTQFRTTVSAGSGIFVQRPSGLDSTWSEDVSLGDLDGDGDLDLFLAHRDAANTAWFNDGSGHFTTNGIDLGSDFVIDGTLGDLDRDGDLDALLAGIQDNHFLRNNGGGVFADAGVIFPGSATIRKVALGDLDGDGDLDAVTATMCDPWDPDRACAYAVHQVWWNDGAGALQPSAQSLGHGTAGGLSLGDLDGDGDLDVMIAGEVAQNSAVWTNLGGGAFTRTQTFTGLSAASVDLGDLDGDGDLDAFVAPPAGATSAVWLNDGHGAFAPGQNLIIPGPAVLGDLDGDGDLDALSAGMSGNQAWFNQGNASFTSSFQRLGTAIYTNPALGDLDGDGDLDAVSSAYDTEPGLWINVDDLLWFPFAGE